MDCRKCLLLALAVCWAGCATSPGVRSKTEVAFADFKAKEAASSRDMQPGQKEALYEQARVAYQRALKLDPNSKEAFAGLGRMYEALGSEDKAADTYRQGLKKYPQEAALWFALGLCDCRRKDWDGAVASLDKARALDHDNRVYVRTLGMTQARVGRAQEAVTTLTQVMPAAEANYTVARMLYQLSKDDQSQQYLQAALRLNPDLAGARDLSALLDGASQPAAAAPARPVVSLGFSSAAGPSADAVVPD